MSHTLSKAVRSMRAKLTAVSAELQDLEAVLEESSIKSSDEARAIITTEEMADILQVSVTTLRRYMKAGKLQPMYQKGKQYYWLRSELKDVLADD